MDNRKVTRAIGRVVWPALREVGFDSFTGRSAWRYAGKDVDVVNLQSFGGMLADSVGCTSFSFQVNLGVWRPGDAFGQGAAEGHHPHGLLRAARAATPPRIDGQLTDEAWTTVPPFSDLTQIDPDEGRPATEKTEIRVLFDDQAIYIGAKMFDSQPSLVSRRLSKRDDDADADRISVYLDPMHDHLTGAIFRVSAAGVQRDQVLFNDTWNDQTWDAVWTSAVAVNQDGWEAEIRIPFSQLRFAVGERQTWGINVERFIRRKNETAQWMAWDRDFNFMQVSQAGHLKGVESIRTGLKRPSIVGEARRRYTQRASRSLDHRGDE